jgi:CDP-diacylglycerol--glycerol-3-phosphate 3-phosphatidyltransferase
MIANAITITRTLFTLPLFLILSYGADEHRWFALALFLGAGGMDMLDGYLARRLNQTSRFGAMLDLIGDRLLTFAALLGLCIAGDIASFALIAAGVLMGRDIIVAALNEALPGKLNIRVSVVEKLKIAAAFLGTTLLIAPDLHPDQNALGGVILCIAGALTLITLADYWMRGLRAFKQA